MGYLRYGMGLPIGVRVSHICNAAEALERIREREGVEIRWAVKTRLMSKDSDKEQAPASSEAMPRKQATQTHKDRCLT